MSWSSSNDSLEALHLPGLEALHLQPASSREAEATFHLDLVAANLSPSRPQHPPPDPHHHYLSLGMVDPNDVLRNDVGRSYQSHDSILQEDEAESYQSHDSILQEDEAESYQSHDTVLQEDEAESYQSHETILQEDEAEFYQSVEGFLEADEVEWYLRGNLSSPPHMMTSSGSEEQHLLSDVYLSLKEDPQLPGPHQAGSPSCYTHHPPTTPHHWSPDFYNTCPPDSVLDPGQAWGGHDGPEASWSGATKKKGARHRHTRKFLPEGEEKQQRGRQLNNEASQVYRKRRKEAAREEQQQLQQLQQQNHYLNTNYCLLQRCLQRYREVHTMYQRYLPAAPCPPPPPFPNPP